MASISFTYNGNYNENEMIVYRSQFDDVYTNNNSSYSFTNNNWGYGFFRGSPIEYSTSFADDDRGVNIGDDYAVNLDFSGNNGSVSLTGGRFGDIFRGGLAADTFYGLGGNDMFEGGAGADTFNGGDDFNTVSYEHSSGAVKVNLSLVGTSQVSGGDADGDILTSIQNLIGSSLSDTLIGDTNANVLTGGDGNDILRGLGGADTLDGGAGKDRLVISQAVAGEDGTSGVTIHGGDDVDTLFLQGHDTFKFSSNTNFEGVEKIYVADGASIDLTGISTGVKIVSQSTLSDPKGGPNGHGLDNVTGSITGTDGEDTIKGGKGTDIINGGTGGDKLFSGTGADTFAFTEGFGRDNVYGFTSGEDLFDVSAITDNFKNIKISDLSGDRGALITFVGVESTNKIIVHDVAASSLHASDFGFFLP